MHLSMDIYNSMDAGYFYQAKTEGDKGYLIAEGHNGIELDINKEVDKEIFQSLEALVNKYKIMKWDDFSKKDEGVEDGVMFHLGMRYADDSIVKVNGHQKFPDHFKEWHEEIVSFFQQYQ